MDSFLQDGHGPGKIVLVLVDVTHVIVFHCPRTVAYPVGQKPKRTANHRSTSPRSLVRKSLMTRNMCKMMTAMVDVIVAGLVRDFEVAAVVMAVLVGWFGIAEAG